MEEGDWVSDGEADMEADPMDGEEPLDGGDYYEVINGEADIDAEPPRTYTRTHAHAHAREDKPTQAQQPDEADTEPEPESRSLGNYKSIREDVKDIVDTVGLAWKQAYLQAGQITDEVMKRRKERNTERFFPERCSDYRQSSQQSHSSGYTRYLGRRYERRRCCRKRARRCQSAHKRKRHCYADYGFYG